MSGEHLDAARLSARTVSLAYGPTTVVTDVDLDVVPGAVTAIVGPNGCGKSTLVRALARLHPAASGQIVLDGKNIDAIPTREVARQLAILPQSPIAPAGLTVRDLVGRGRMPHLKALRPWGPDDSAAVDRALEATGLTALTDTVVDTLSGGQRQRAWIAVTLAQETELMLLDEPTTFLDIAHQYEVLDLIHGLSRQGRTVVVVLHDLAQAARYADHLILMSGGRIVARGNATDVLSAERVKEAFGLDVTVVPDPVSGTPLIVPTGLPGGLPLPHPAYATHERTS